MPFSTPSRPGGDHHREREVRVGRGVGAADLGPGALDRLAGRDLRDADQRRAVRPAPGEVRRRLVARDEPLVRVDERREHRGHAPGVGEDAGHVRPGDVREAVRVGGVGEGVLLVGDRVERLVGVHPGAVDPVDRLGHERRVEAVLLGDRLERELERDRVVGGRERVAVLEVDLVLPDRDLVVGGLDPDPERLEGVDHVLADLLGEVGREVEVAGLVVGQRLDPAVGAAPEQEELQLRAGVDDVAQLLRPLDLAAEDAARVADERLARRREHVADDAGRAARPRALLPRDLGERGHVGHEVLVALGDPGEALDRAAVEPCPVLDGPLRAGGSGS